MGFYLKENSRPLYHKGETPQFSMKIKRDMQIQCVGESSTFWVITRRQVVIYYRRFGTIFRSHPEAVEWLVFITEI